MIRSRGGQAPLRTPGRSRPCGRGLRGPGGPALLLVALLLAAPPPAPAVAQAATVRTGSARGPSEATDPGLERLEAELARLAESSGGTVGVAALHLETGRAAYLNRSEPFPMASTYKVPIAVELLTRVDRGELRLDSLVEVRPVDLHPGSGTLTQLFQAPGVALSLRNLMELMLIISDNSATDMVLRAAGGPAAVTGRMAALGVPGIRVDRPTSVLIADFVGVAGVPPGGEISSAEFRERAAALDEEARQAAAAAFAADLRDTATPEGMAELLRKVWQREALSEESTRLLLDVLERVTTGAARLRGVLPAPVTVAHKTGTIGGTTNDVGIVHLPGDAGHVVVAVFVKDSSADVPQRERTIAHLARAVHDYFLFNP